MDTKKLYFNKEDLYDKYRPLYPEDIISPLINDLSYENKKVADIGAGTGHLTGYFLKHGFTVFAIEPNSRMVEIMNQKYKGHYNFNSILASSETTGLPNNSVDVVAFGQSFHWCDNEDSINEIKRILKPRGKIFICWNIKDKEEDYFNVEFENLLLSLFPVYGTNRTVFYNEKSFKTRFDHKSIEVKSIKNHQILDIEGFIGRHESNSYFNSDLRDEFVLNVERLFNQVLKTRFIKINYTCQIFILSF